MTVLRKAPDPVTVKRWRIFFGVLFWGYATGAVLEWHLNPSLWETETREFIGFMSMMIAPLGALAPRSMFD